MPLTIDLEEYHKMIRKVIWIYMIKHGPFEKDDLDELVNIIYLRLKEKEENICSKFRGASKFSTYLNVVIYRICIELNRGKSRADKKTAKLTNLSDEQRSKWFENIGSGDLSAESKMIIQEYSRRLEILLQTYAKSRIKMEFTLKAIFRMRLLISYLGNLDKIISGIEIIMSHYWHPHPFEPAFEASRSIPAEQSRFL